MVGAAIAFALFIVLVNVLADTRHLGLIGEVYDMPHGDKIGHFILYAVLTFLVSLALFELRSDRSTTVLVLVAAFAIAALVALEEATQAWLPSRSSDVRDLIASCLGIGCGALVALRFRAPEEVR